MNNFSICSSLFLFIYFGKSRDPFIWEVFHRFVSFKESTKDWIIRITPKLTRSRFISGDISAGTEDQLTVVLYCTLSQLPSTEWFSRSNWRVVDHALSPHPSLESEFGSALHVTTDTLNSLRYCILKSKTEGTKQIEFLWLDGDKKYLELHLRKRIIPELNVPRKIISKMVRKKKL